MRVVLKVIEGPDAGREFVFDGFQQFVLGRDGQRDANTRVPRDPYMSRNHAILVFSASGCHVRDLNSSNGIFVNGDQVPESELTSGDLLQAGRTVMRIEVEQRAPASRSDPDSAEVRPPIDRLAHFELERRLDKGSVAEVYVAHDLERERVVALKVVSIQPDDPEEAVQHFLRETKIHMRLRHPHVVRTLDSGREDDFLWLSMELVDGETFETRVERDGPQPTATVATVARHLLDALDCAHGQGFIHRDIKPANIMLEPLPGGFLTKLLDFGFAKSFRDPGSPCLTSSGNMKGTPRFTAREQVLNAKNVGPVADLFSVGACMYFALTGKWHYELAGRNAWAAILDGKNVPIRTRRPDLKASLAKVIDTALSKEPEDRHSSAAAMLKALQKAV